jgi:hypothetical protein
MAVLIIANVRSIAAAARSAMTPYPLRPQRGSSSRDRAGDLAERIGTCADPLPEYEMVVQRLKATVELRGMVCGGDRCPAARATVRSRSP